MRGLSQRTRDALYRQASAQGANGLGLVQILEDFEQRLLRRSRKGDAAFVSKVAGEVRDGKPLALALGASVSSAERQILAAGEESGDLWSAMRLALTMRELTGSIRSAFMSALLSPLVYVVTLWACLAIIGIRVTPAFISMLPVSNWGPWAKTMYYLGEAASSWYGLLVVGLFLVGSGWIMWARNNWVGKGRITLDRFMFPFTLFVEIEGFVWLMTYSALLRSKIPDTNALEMQIDVGSKYLQSRLTPVLARLKNGKTLPDSLRGTGYGFPSMDLIDEIGAYAGFSDFADKIENVGRDYAAEMKRRLNAKAFMTGAIFGGVVFLVMGIVQLGANEIQSAIMSTVGARI